MRIEGWVACCCLLLTGCAGELAPGMAWDEALDDASVEEDPIDDAGTRPDTRASRPDTATAAPTEDTSSPPSPIEDTKPSTPDTKLAVDTATGPIDTGPPPVEGCSLTLPSATGKEPGGAIPVCCTPSPADRAANMEVFAMVNEHRKANGKAELVYDLALEAAIQGHCQHMKTHSFFDHGAPESAISSFTTRASKCGAKAGGENIAWGQTSPKEVMSSWKSSSGHNSNMLSGSWKRMGVGKSGTYWGQIFAP